MPKGHEVGLVSDERYERLLKKIADTEAEIERIKSINVGPTAAVQAMLEKYGSTPLKSGMKLSELVKRPELDYYKIAEIDPERPELPKNVTEQVNIMVKYEGYIKQQMNQVEQFKKLESKLLPEDIDYTALTNLRIEAKQKLDAIRPRSIGQAARITGVSPADITALLIHLEQLKR